MKTALVTGASAGLGRALTTALAEQGWTVVVDARGRDRLNEAVQGLGSRVRALAGDVAEPYHRDRLVDEVNALGRLDLLVNNASTLGQTPLPALAALDLDAFDDTWLTNVMAPLALTQALLPVLVASHGILVSISSDAAVEHYPGWGAYGATKAALDHVILTLGEENHGFTAYAVDPGDMRTAMHQQAFPGEDISDRPLPEAVVPNLLELIRLRPASGRHRAADFAPGSSQAIA
jgi:NAD(P)-dependent dehydrogenase (short-subunit alcohol dehydrogenase family)